MPGDPTDSRYPTMQTLGTCPDAVAVRLCGDLAASADGRLEARTLLDVIGRTSVLHTARLSFRVGSKVGSQRLDAGWIVESFSAADAVETAYTVAAAVASVSYGIVPQLWDVHKTELHLDPAATYVSRLFATGTAAGSSAGGSNYSPLVEYLTQIDVGGVVSASFLPAPPRPVADVVCTSRDQPTELMAALTALEMSRPDEGIGIASSAGLGATRLLMRTTDEGGDDRPLLGAAAVADLYSTTRRLASAARLYGRATSRKFVDFIGSADPSDVPTNAEER